MGGDTQPRQYKQIGITKLRGAGVWECEQKNVSKQSHFQGACRGIGNFGFISTNFEYIFVSIYFSPAKNMVSTNAENLVG